VALPGLEGRKAFKKDGVTNLFVKEVFPTLQGEGPLTGTPAVFVRLAGCNLKCWYCDTDFLGGTRFTVPQILAAVGEECPPSSVGGRLVVLTGGEPFAQNLVPLVTSLLGNKYRVQIETAGTLWQNLPEHPDLCIVVSPKTPKVHSSVRLRAMAWKYVVDASKDYDPVDGLPTGVTQDSHEAGGGVPDPETEPRPLAKPTRGCPVYLQPMHEDDEEKTQRNVEEAAARCLKYGHRLSLQTHKILGLP